MDFKLLAHQFSFVTSQAKNTVLIAGRGSGKSFAAAVLAVTSCLRGEEVIFVSPTYKTSLEVGVAAVIDFMNRCHIKGELYKSAMKISIGKGNILFMSAENPERLRGLSNKTKLIIDEAAICSKDVYDLGSACLRGEHITNPQIYIITTPRGRGNWVTTIFEKLGTLAITARTIDNKFVGIGFVELLKEQYEGMDSFYKQEVLGEILDEGTNSLFSTAEWNFFNESKAQNGNQIIVGLDVAGDGNDFTALTLRRGNQIEKIVKTKTKTSEDILNFVRLHAPMFDRLFIDVTGFGYFAADKLIETYHDKICKVNFAASSIKNGYKNRRTEIHFDLKKRIAEGLFLSSSIDATIKKEIEFEFFSIDTYISGQSDFALIKKEDIKKKIGRSPDILDSLALASFNINAEIERNDELRQLNAKAMASNPFSKQKTNQKQSWNRI